ncbi:hypothetical protein B0I26_10428 [Anoxybacillus vitaminiphilus]|uniref:PD-(D/E)XK nuclease superfamily protein n=1 Tax=Paranoxybacillus vitaminiphilus TaxID=581036 RepID=A0A327YJA7_9BACL|nr:hypothetical protein B0I26_10428 [Anoxybacillus vitaminiphilus]
MAMQEKGKVLERIYAKCNKPMPFAVDEIERIVCHLEYAFGRRRKIDLVVEIQLADGNRKYIVMEMKVDSIPELEQLEGTYSDFLHHHQCKEDDALFLLFIFGSAQVCMIPNHRHFYVLKLPDIIEAFQGLLVDHYISTDWMDSLKQEEIRKQTVVETLKSATNLKDENYWRKRGYRLWFSLFHYLYDDLKHHSKRANEWEVYSASNNPLMNLEHGWLRKELFQKLVHFYWEFNYEQLFLKLAIDQINPLTKEELTHLRSEITQICRHASEKRNKQGPTRNTNGAFVSLYKWKFDFVEEDFVDS